MVRCLTQDIRRRTLTVALAVCIAAPWPAVQSRELRSGNAATQTIAGLTAKQIAAEAAEHEIEFLHYRPPFLRYRMHVVDSKGDQIREVIQSRDGAVARLLARDNRPLTPEEDAAERERLQAMIDSPDTYQRHRKEDTTGKRTAEDLIRLLPEAMIFTFVEGQPQRPGEGSAREIVIDFRSDPDWSAPTMASDVLTGLQGRMWIDEKTHSLLAIEGSIFRPVNFGYLVAHIDPGGTLSLEQNEVEPDRWSFLHFAEHITLRVPLIFKTVRENRDVSSSDFAVVNPMSYQDAIRLLLADPLPSH